MGNLTNPSPIVKLLNRKLIGKKFLYKSKYGSQVCEIAEISMTYQVEDINGFSVIVSAINIKSTKGHFYNMSDDKVYFLDK